MSHSCSAVLCSLHVNKVALFLQALSMVNAIQVRGYQQQQQPSQGRRNRVAASPAADMIDTSAQQQVAALGALVAMLLQLQVRHALTASAPSACMCMCA